MADYNCDVYDANDKTNIEAAIEAIADTLTLVVFQSGDYCFVCYSN